MFCFLKRIYMCCLCNKVRPACFSVTKPVLQFAVGNGGLIMGQRNDFYIVLETFGQSALPFFLPCSVLTCIAVSLSNEFY